MRGNGLFDAIGKAFGFAKKNKLISKGLTAAAPAAGSYAPLVGTAGAIAGLLGLGIKRRAPRKRVVRGKGKKKPAPKRRPRRK